MFDVGSCGPSFTWSNKRKRFAHIKERLDKAVVNIEWQNMFPEASLIVLTAGGSDHSPIYLSTHPKNPRLPRPFRFHNMWLREVDCENLIIGTWKKANGVTESNITKTLSSLSRDPIKWNKKKIGKVEDVIRSTRADLESIRHNTPSENNIMAELELNAKLDEYLVEVEDLW